MKDKEFLAVIDVYPPRLFKFTGNMYAEQILENYRGETVTSLASLPKTENDSDEISYFSEF